MPRAKARAHRTEKFAMYVNKELTGLSKSRHYGMRCLLDFCPSGLARTTRGRKRKNVQKQTATLLGRLCPHCSAGGIPTATSSSYSFASSSFAFASQGLIHNSSAPLVSEHHLMVHSSSLALCHLAMVALANLKTTCVAGSLALTFTPSMAGSNTSSGVGMVFARPRSRISCFCSAKEGALGGLLRTR
jgi:hypothetical protein